MERLFITGGAGYIGSLLVERLAGSGRPVTVLDSLLYCWEGLRGLERRVNLIRGDVRDPLLTERLEGHDALLLLAGVVGEPAAKRYPEATRQINIDATRLWVEAAEKYGVTKLLFVSSCSVYGDKTGEQPVAEDASLSGLGPYAESKIEGERVVAEGRVPWVVARLATVYGASLRMRFDLLVNDFVRAAVREGVIEVYQPEVVRPFISVKDVAAALELLLDAEGIFNVGVVGENYSKGTLSRLVAERTGARVEQVPSRSDTRNYAVSFERLARRLPFSPQERVPSGITEVLAWLEKHPDADPYDPRYSNHLRPLS